MGRTCALRGLGVLYFLGLAILFFQPPGVQAADRLDPSWQLLLAHDFVTGAQSGRDTIFTYGPLAPIVLPRGGFTAQIWPAALLGNALRAAVLALALAWLAVRARPRWLGLFVLLVPLIAFPALQDTSFVVLIAAYGVLVARSAAQSPLVLAAAAMVPLAGAALCKFSFTVQVIATVFVLVAILAMRRDWRRALTLAVSLCAIFVAGWISLGQEVGNIPAFFSGSLEIASGYNDAASISGDPLQLVLMIAQVGVFVVLLLVAEGWRWSRLAETGVLLVAAGIAWKSGVVRQDGGHELTFFPSLALLGLLVASQEPKPTRLRTAAILVSVGIALVGIVHADAGSPTIPQRLDQLRRVLGPALAPDATRKENMRANDMQRAFLNLPRIRKRVGTATIDCLSERSGILVLHGMNVRHRPIFQSYSAYTAELQRQNAEFFRSTGAPEYVLLAVSTIDGRFALADDSLAWLELLRRYDPVLVERGFALLEQAKHPATEASPAPLLARAIALGERLILPTERPSLETLAIQAEWTPLGKLRALAFDAPRLYLELELETGQRERFRISKSGTRNGFLLSPRIRSTQDFLRAYAGRGTRVRALRIVAAPGHESYFEPRLAVTLRRCSALDRTVQTSKKALEHLVHTSQLSMLTVSPSIDVQWQRMPSIVQTPIGIVSVVEPPSQIRLRVPAGRVRLELRFGLLPSAWKTSDGVTFVVSRRAAADSAGTHGITEIYRRHVDPRKNPEDRRMITEAAELTFERPTWLVLATDPGPKGDRRDDRAYWQRISASVLGPR